MCMYHNKYKVFKPTTPELEAEARLEKEYWFKQGYNFRNDEAILYFLKYKKGSLWEHSEERFWEKALTTEGKEFFELTRKYKHG